MARVVVSNAIQCKDNGWRYTVAAFFRVAEEHSCAWHVEHRIWDIRWRKINSDAVV